MSEITLCDSVNNFEMERSDIINKTSFVEEPLSFNDKCIYSGLSKAKFSSLSSKDKANALYYTPNKLKSKSDICRSSLDINNSRIRSGNEKYPHSQWSNSNAIYTDSLNHSNEILDSLAQSMKLYNDDVSLMIKDLFSNTQGTDLTVNDIDNFFKYSLIIGKYECSISEKILNSIRDLSGKLVNKTQEISELQQKLAYKTCMYNAKLGNSMDLIHSNQRSVIRNDDFDKEYLSNLEILTEQMDNNKTYYENLINDLLNEIRQRDELLDCYQKRENYLFNNYYPVLLRKSEKNDLNEIQNKENIINELCQKLSEVKNAFQEELKIKNKVIQEMKNQMISNEKLYFGNLKNKEDTLNKLTEQYQDKEKKFKEEIDRYKSRSAAQAKLAEYIRSQIKSQQIEYCKKIEDMQQNLDSRGKIIAYVQNKLNIRENELKIANIRFTTVERQMNIEKDQYKREITNLKDELEKTNLDIEDLENELDTLEDNMLADHREELDRLENEHDFQLNKLWNIIDQRENTINDMENEMEDLKEKIKNLEKALSKYEGDTSEDIQNRSEHEEEKIENMNEKSSVTVTGNASEEIIVIEEYKNILSSEPVSSSNSKISDDHLNYSLTSEFISDDEEYEKTELITTDENEGANSLTLTEDVSEENEMEESSEFIREEKGQYDLEENLRRVKEENEQLKCQLDLVKNDNDNLRRQLQQEKENLERESEKCSLQQQECETLTQKYSQVLNEKEEIKNKCFALENENKKRKENEKRIEEEYKISIEKQEIKFQKERESQETRLNQLKESVKNSISLDQYTSLQTKLQTALDAVSEQRKKKDYLKQKLTNQYEKNKALVELIKKERTQSREEIKQLKQSCVKQNGKIKAILKQVKEGLVMYDHIDIDRIVKRMKNERVNMSNEYERLKKVASSISIKSASIKQSFSVNNEIPLKRKGSRKDLSRKSKSEGNVEITVKKFDSNKTQNDSKILIKVASPVIELLPDESIVSSKQANDSLNSINSMDDQKELEEFNLKKALSKQDNINYLDDDEEIEQNSFADFTSSQISYELEEEKKEKEEEEEEKEEENRSSIKDNDNNISHPQDGGTNIITPQQMNICNRVFQLPHIFTFNVKGDGSFEIDDSNFSITSDSSILKENEEHYDKRNTGLKPFSTNRIRYKSFTNNEYGNNHRTSLRRMPNFDHIGKLTQIKIKHSTEEIIV